MNSPKATFSYWLLTDIYRYCTLLIIIICFTILFLNTPIELYPLITPGVFIALGLWILTDGGVFW